MDILFTITVIMRVATYIFKSGLIFQTGLRYIWQHLGIANVCVLTIPTIYHPCRYHHLL